MYAGASISAGGMRSTDRAAEGGFAGKTLVEPEKFAYPSLVIAILVRLGVVVSGYMALAYDRLEQGLARPTSRKLPETTDQQDQLAIRPLCQLKMCKCPFRHVDEPVRDAPGLDSNYFPIAEKDSESCLASETGGSAWTAIEDTVSQALERL